MKQNTALKCVGLSFLGLLAFIAILMLAAFLYYISVTAGVRLQPEKLALDTSCIRLYDAHGQEIESAFSRDISYGELPEHLTGAFVSVEDKRFYEHNGFDKKRIVKAAWNNLKSFSFREGASTISQQLIKNTHLSGEKTLSRKLRELKLTRALEKKYSKEEILELYLNSIYFGHNAFGIGSAAKYYFGKETEQLTPAESAMLAALVKSPNRYSPFKCAEKCLERRNFVLGLMRDQGVISAAECDAARQEPLPEAPTEEKATSSYIAYVFEELSELFPDLESSEMRNLRVFTFLEPDLQSKIEATECDSDLCIVVRDNKTQGLKALHSTLPSLPKRLPASTIKPLLVYAPAVEEDYLSPATPILDEAINFGGYSPSNYTNSFGGYMSARYALAHSVNIPAVKILNSLGIERAAGYLSRMNLPVSNDDYSLALALGGMREGYRLTELADGYATLANGGMYTRAFAISRVEDNRGNTLYTTAPEARRVFSAETCYLLTDMLKTAVKEGTAKRLSALGYPIAAKTGTGGTAAGNTDAYTISYTSDDTVAVWLGNRDNSPVSATGGGTPANIALAVNRLLYSGHAPTPFPECDGVAEAMLDREEYDENHRLILADPLAPAATGMPELFKKSALPSERSARFSRPSIATPSISVTNGGVCIILCQTKYYEYVIKREGDGQTVTIYSGKYREKIFDNSVRAGVEYRYTVTPIYLDVQGESVQLPCVKVPAKTSIPQDWWLE